MALTSWLLGIIFLVFVYKVFKRIVKLSQYLYVLSKIPGPKGVPILGNLFKHFLNPREDLGNEFVKMLKEQLNLGRGIINMRIGTACSIFLIKGSSTEVILRSTKHLDKSSDYQFIKGVLGDGLLVSKRELWEKRRKMINPSFHQGFIKSFLPIFNEKVDIFMEIMENLAEKGPFDVDPHLRNLSLDMICQSVMGVNVDSQRNPNGELVKAHKEIGDSQYYRMFKPWLWPTFIYNRTNIRQNELKCIKTIRQYSWKVIQERRKYLEQCKELQQYDSRENKLEDEEIIGKKRHKATSDVLLESTCGGKKLLDEEIIDEVVIQIAAGHETTASGISFALYLLGLHPDIQKRVQDELDQVIGDSDRHLTHDDLNDMKFLDATIKESFRIYPPIPMFSRELDEDIVIDGYTVPAKTTIAFSLITIHRDPGVFPDPDKFNPERFLGSNGRSLSNYEYMPFSAGPRNCIGYKIAQHEIKIVLAHILRKYDVISHDKVEDIKLSAGPDLRSVHGINISLQRRKNTFT